MTNTEFKFNPTELTRPRPFGISAYMRIKNEAQFVRLCIESHLPFYDEIICVYNDCTDNTENILLELQKQHPDKIKVFHYLPKVHRVGTPEHAATAGHDDDVHSLANYYNFAVSQCSYSIATKLDADHLAIPHKLAPIIKRIRAEFAEGKDKLFLFSGLNVIRNANGEPGMVKKGEQFSGNGDIFYHRIDSRSFFTNHQAVEHLNQAYRYGVPAEYVGILYIHLKSLKTEIAKPALQQNDWMPFTEFATRKHIKTIEKKLKFTRKIRLALLKCKPINHLHYKITGKYPKIRVQRLINLYDDLQTIDFQRDAIDKLR